MKIMHFKSSCHWWPYSIWVLELSIISSVANASQLWIAESYWVYFSRKSYWAHLRAGVMMDMAWIKIYLQTDQYNDRSLLKETPEEPTGAHATNTLWTHNPHVGNYVLLSLMNSPYDQIITLHMSWQQSCHDICKILTWLDNYLSCQRK